MKYLVINGPNINMLGIREPAIYGSTSYPALLAKIDDWADSNKIEVECFQSNHEGSIVDKIQSALTENVDGIVINPAAYTHTSIAILDALKAVAIPAVEVHISDINEREAFRHLSYAGMACFEHVIGKGLDGYTIALDILKNTIK